MLIQTFFNANDSNFFTFFNPKNNWFFFNFFLFTTQKMAIFCPQTRSNRSIQQFFELPPFRARTVILVTPPGQEPYIFFWAHLEKNLKNGTFPSPAKKKYIGKMRARFSHSMPPWAKYALQGGFQPIFREKCPIFRPIGSIEQFFQFFSKNWVKKSIFFSKKMVRFLGPKNSIFFKKLGSKKSQKNFVGCDRSKKFGTD